ncbi:LysR family transcriptional regulator [Cognatishimia sp. F0-27]|uniref:LysR family transcriptional regulator n=1 Tax=Cognatishimia sp. F0-27 TaxID=2816855 RepID=UPI001D0C9AC2|nr:LysR family transcriptional regulator [Cognatishimia sp. F0-27]MCC1491694.1 LysR family transcriptional regulator [Cognatishimia sp. F0-27]
MSVPSLPPLSALRAFSAFAETGSLVAAGAALNVSHAAISQQLRKLEAHLGVPLLDRSGRQMALTVEGMQLAQVLGESFERIAQVTDALTGADATRALHITCTPSFASAWLMPRLADFRSVEPEIEVLLNPSPERIDPAPGGVDVALRYGAGPWPGLENEPLVSAPIVVVGVPSLFPDGPPQSRDALIDYPWLQEIGNNEARYWREQIGVTGLPKAGLTRVPGNLMIDGALRGQGLAMTTRLAVADDIEAGRLLVLFQGMRDEHYHIVTAPGFQRPPLRAFIRWLRRSARADGPRRSPETGP